MQRLIGSVFLMAMMVIAASGCGGDSKSIPPSPLPPQPSISSISPTSAVAGSTDLQLTVTGANFSSGNTVVWLANGSQTSLATAFVSSTKLTAIVPAALLNAVATLQVFVLASSRQSNSTNFAVNFPVPTVSSISPLTAQAGAAPLALTVNGTGFFSSSTVKWNGVPKAATLVNGTTLTAAITIPDLASPGTVQVTVSNPTPGGGTSFSSSFTITQFTSNPTPAISSLSDQSAWADWPGFPLTVNGSGFVAATTLQWNGLNRPTTVLSATSLKGGISANDLIGAGSTQVAMLNPSPGGGTSNSVGFTIKPVPLSAIGVIERSSIANDLTEGDFGSEAASISADGRLIAFSSDATGLVPGDTNGFTDIFLRDSCLGTPAGCVPGVSRVSVATDGTQANGFSFHPAISANGRYVAFVSDADNLVSGDTNHFPDVFVRDTCFGGPIGCVASTVRVSLNNDGTQILLQNGEPAINADGRFVAFGSGMVDYYYGPSFNIFVRDTCAGAPIGCTPSTQLVSGLPNGQAGSIGSESPAISSNGRFVGFQSADRMTLDDNDQMGDVFLRDTCIGAPAGCKPSTILISQGDPGSQSANGVENATSVSETGRFVTFNTHNSGGQPAATFVQDTCIGAPVGCSPSTTRVSVDSGGQAANGDSFDAALSSSGRFIAFASNATNLVPGDTNSAGDIFVRDTCFGAAPGCLPSTVRVSVTLDGGQATGDSSGPTITANGHFVAFISSASNLALGDTNKADDVLLSETNFNP